jgi:hypothetical protein
MTPDEAFKSMLRTVAFDLRAAGFRGSGMNYTRQLRETWQAIGFQRSMWRTDRSNSVSFTINFGVFIPTLKGHFGGDVSDVRKLTAHKCDWSFRIGTFMPGDLDRWWDVDEHSLVESTTQIREALRTAILPALERLSVRKTAAKIAHAKPAYVTVGARQWLGSLAPPIYVPPATSDETRGRVLVCDSMGNSIEYTLAAKRIESPAPKRKKRR